MRALLLLIALVCAVYALPPHIVVIGQGVGGVTIANYYSRDPTVRVLFLDMGPEQCAACDLSIGGQLDPSQYNQLSFFPQPQQFLRFVREPVYPQFTGKGGNSKIYGCVNTWPSKEFLDSWPAGLRYDDLLPYFKKNENHYCNYLPESYTGISPANCSSTHGYGGYFDVAPQAHDEWSSQIQDLVAYAKSPGGPGWTGDYNAPTGRSGFHEEQAFRRMANRTNPYSARFRADAQISFFNSSVSSRPNLEVINSAHVDKLIINPTTKRVVAVRYTVDGASTLVVPLKRVFICAGVLRTPQLLMVSGVGPADFLAELDISPISLNGNIGKTLAAHMSFIMAYETNSNVFHNSSMSSYNALQWFFATGLQPAPFKDDVQVVVTEGFYVEDTELSSNGLPIVETFGLLTGQSEFPYLSPQVELHYTLSNGYVRPSTPSMRDPPNWDLGWGFAPFFGGDLARLLTAIGIVRNTFLGNNSFANANIKREVVPGPYYLQQIIDAGITEDQTLGTFGMDLQTFADFMFLQQRLTHFYHITSSVPITVATNIRGEVNGVVGINVCDGSLLYKNPDGNPSALIAALCHKMAHDNFVIDFPGRTPPS